MQRCMRQLLLKDRRAQADIQFNWIFILVVGTIILIFFFAIVVKQRESSQKASDMYASRQIENIISSAESIKNAITEVSVTKTDISFECNKMRVGSSAQKQLNSIQIYAPGRINTDKLWVWTDSWSAPYRVTNFIYILSPKNIKYVFTGDCSEGSLCKKVSQEMPREAGITISQDPGTEQLSSFDRVRIVYFGSSAGDVPLALQRKENSAITALTVDGDDVYGGLKFYKKKKDQFTLAGEISYYQPSMLYGAIVTDDFMIYSCVLDNTFKRLKIVSDVYESRTSALESYYNAGTCRDKMYEAKGIISFIKGYGKEDMDDLKDKAKALDAVNSIAISSSCTAIY